MELKGARALVTGGAVRVGRCICEALAERGCAVVIHYRSSEAEAESLADSIRSKGGAAESLQADLNDPAATSSLIENAGDINILINNASIFDLGRFDILSPEQSDTQIRVNFEAPVQLMSIFAEQRKRGCVINLLDQRIANKAGDDMPYVVAKKKLAKATLSAALDYAPDIRVNGVAPGPVLVPAGSATAALSEKAGPIPLIERPGPDDVARAVCFLIGADSITGQIIYVDGGQHLLV